MELLVHILIWESILLGEMSSVGLIRVPNVNDDCFFSC